MVDKYEIIEKLGAGTFAEVFKAVEKETGQIVAIKKLKKKYSTWDECLDLREAKSLKKLNGNPHIIKLKEMIYVKENGSLNLIFEYMEKDVFEMMRQRNNKRFNENQIRCAIWQTLQGLSYMHKYGFFHRDLKPENLLVSGEVIKIADFGLAREIRSVPPYTEYVSTRYYRAPECILKSTNYNSPVDIWAVGCIMAEMYLFPNPIFFGNNEKEVLFRICSVLGTPNQTIWSEGLQLASKIDLKFPNTQGTPLKSIIPDASKDAIDFMYEMLQWDPHKRATANSLLQHPFFTKFPVPTRISTPDFYIESEKGVKTYTSKGPKGNPQAIKTEQSYVKDDDFSKILNDTEGFDRCKVKATNLSDFQIEGCQNERRHEV